MTEESRQTDQARVRIDSRSIPAQQGPDGEGMPQIVQPWGAYTGRHVQLELRQQRVKRQADRALTNSPAPGERKQRRFGIGLRAEAPVEVARQALTHAWAERHEPGLVELGVAHRQRRPFEVNIAHQQPGDLADAQAQPVQQREHRLVDKCAMRCLRSSTHAAGGLEQPLRIGEAEQVGDALAGHAPRTCIDRIALDHSLHRRPIEEPACRTDEVVVAARTLARTRSEEGLDQPRVDLIQRDHALVGKVGVEQVQRGSLGPVLAAKRCLVLQEGTDRPGKQAAQLGAGAAHKASPLPMATSRSAARSTLV